MLSVTCIRATLPHPGFPIRTGGHHELDNTKLYTKRETFMLGETCIGLTLATSRAPSQGWWASGTGQHIIMYIILPQ